MKKLFTCYCRAIAMPRYAMLLNNKAIAQVNDNFKEIAQMLLNNSDGNIRSLKVGFNLRESKRVRKYGLRSEHTIAKVVQVNADALYNHNYCHPYAGVCVNCVAIKNHTGKTSRNSISLQCGCTQINSDNNSAALTINRNKNTFLLPITYSVSISHTYTPTLTAPVSISDSANVITSMPLQSNAEPITISADRNITVSNNYSLGFGALGSSIYPLHKLCFETYSARQFALPKEQRYTRCQYSFTKRK